MDIALAIKALILGIVEGLTEFLPISSTGHLILAGQLLDFNDEKGKIFEIVIQFGAILAVCWEFRHKIIDVIKGLPNDPRQQRFAINVIVATIPAITLALIFGKAIKAHLFNPIVVASAFIIGGFVILWAEWRERHRGETHDPRANALLEAAKAGAPRIETLDDLRISDAIKVGFRAVLRADSGHVALRLDHHRRPAVWAVAQGGDGVLVFPGDSRDFRCDGVRAVQVACAAVGR